MKIKKGTKCDSVLYGIGTVVDLYDDSLPYMFYPIVVVFDKEPTLGITYDSKGNTMKQKTDTPDAVFYE